MILDGLLLWAFRFRLRINAGARHQIVQDGAGRTWPLYHTRAAPETGISGVPILFLHGFGNDSYTWFPLFSILDSNREHVAVDLPGFGGHAPQGEDRFTPAWYADQCSNLVRELAVRWGQPPILVGKSMGGMIAGLVAARIPDLCRALVLIDPGGIESPRISPFWNAYREGRNILLPRNDAEWETMVRMLYYRPRRIPGFVRRSAIREISSQYTLQEEIFTRLLDEGMDPLGAQLSRIRCPLTVIWGAEDQVMDPSGAERLRKESGTEADIVVIPRCGHSPTSEALPEVCAALQRVIARFG